ncbi:MULTISPECIES: inositol monophosphatase family protein [unclassified Dietzia]|uniref:inositol monophosphatase family protein n=1 Tax=unclassified Dietzia TaxID=2617939 RepID=UPI000D2214E3|nr:MULTISPECIES: inositol monophosphatase family protein [unclassified Dietzia]AVZ39354.1 inositol monophosphatase [Dietzia sp. JS16-p6b]MBB1024530.1 inositol monophosphatase [Dietzia sp. DQ12-76]MBB1028499.1 inositol monophosphatase [Dietzia sp. DQ11-38-2]QGW24613.1 extragenic suppressor protein SuhB [Dietzia sp. DQ12-45-1b]
MSEQTVEGLAGRDHPVDVDELRVFAERLAVSGGGVARRMLERFDSSGLDPRAKSSATDPVTVIDTTVERHLRELVSTERPGDRVLGEEGGEEVSEEPAATGRGVVRWVVDPVDGTVNLLYGIPFTAVSVAAEVDGVVVAGAVHNIVTGETWTAAVGRGSSLRSAAGTVTELAASSCDDLSMALVGTGFSYDAEIRAEQGRTVAALLPTIRDIRRCGSAALDLCMVATGRVDAYFERCLKPWDHAAGALIAAEAGAMVRVAADDEVPTVAAAPGVAEELLAALEALGDPVSS